MPDAGLSFEPAELVFETETDTGREGVIRVRHRAGKPARGYVYPSERCMRGVREQFAPAADGTGYIRWQFDARGIAPGRTISGSFRVISPYGEYEIPYYVEISGKGELARRKNPALKNEGGRPDRTSAGTLEDKSVGKAAVSDGGASKLPEKIRTKSDFLAMAEADFKRAAVFFYGSRFEEILTKEEDRTLYRGLSMQEGNLQNVEEFLIAACGKEKTLFEPVEKSLFLQTEARAGRAEGRLAGSRAERALEAHRQRVRRNSMGAEPARQQEAAKEEDLIYIPLQIRQTGTGFIGPVIRAEGRFLPAAPFEVPDNALQNRQEASGIFTVRIPVNRAALHAGRNFGRIVIQGPFNEAVIPVEVHCRSAAAQMRRKKEKETDLLQLQLMQLYVDLRIEEEHPEDWFLQADRLIDEISMRSHRDLIPRLYGVHLLILRGQNAEAQRELGRIASRYAGSDSAQNFSARFTGEQEGAYCYRQYLYARSRLEDVQLRGRVVRFLRGVYRQTGDWRTAWMLLDLAEEYAPGTANRWNFLRHQFESGCNSPVIWIEAWDMVRENPQILLPGSSVQERWARDDFGLHVLWYAARNRVLTPKAAEVMITLAEKKKTFSPLLYKGLCTAYEMWAEEGPTEEGEGAPEDHTGREREEMKNGILRAICMLLVRGQDLSMQAHKWYARALQEQVSLTNLEENWLRSMEVDDEFYRLPAGRNAVLRTTASRAVRAVLVYDRFRGEESYAIRRGVAFLPVYGDANTIFLEDAAGNRYAKSLPYALDFREKPASDGSDDENDGRRKMQRNPSGESVNPRELAEWLGFGSREEVPLRTEPEAAAALLDSGLLTGAAQTRLLLLCLEQSGNDQKLLKHFLTRADLSKGGSRDRALLLGCYADAGEFDQAIRLLSSYGSEGVSAKLQGRICMGLSWEAGLLPSILPIAWEAYCRGNHDTGLLERLSAAFEGLSSELLDLRKTCSDNAVSTAELDDRIIRQALYSGAVAQPHAQIIVSAGKKMGSLFLPAVAQYADYAFSAGISLGNRMTELIAGLIADGELMSPASAGGAASAESSGVRPGRHSAASGTLPASSSASAQADPVTASPDEIGDICRIACLKELSMRQGDISEREKKAARSALSALLSRGIIFPFYRQFPGYDDRLDLYAEETLVQYHPSEPDDGSGRRIVFHYTTSRRGEAGSYKTRPMKEMYRDFFVSGFLLFYGEQMHYYITDDAAGKHVVQSGMIGQDARILESCSGRFGLINETTRAAALREYDKALSLLTGYYSRSYLESELFRR